MRIFYGLQARLYGIVFLALAGLFVLGATLLMFAFVTNVIAQRIVENFRRKRGGT